MNNNMSKDMLDHLRKNYEKACNAYLVALLDVWELDPHYGYWIADEVGGLYAYGDCVFINMQDIIYCVENNVSYNTYMEWLDYCTWAEEFGQDTPNIESWCMGCPRVSDEEQKKLTDMKLELNKLMEETKKNVKEGKF